MGRIIPALGPEGYKTYALSAPLATHFRPATCEEANCKHWLRGWSTGVPAGSDLEAAVRSSGRPFKEVHADGQVVFLFEPGTPCFRTSMHRVPLEREPLLLVQGGDWRGNPRGVKTRRHTRPEHWVEEFAEHTDRIAKDRS